MKSEKNLFFFNIVQSRRVSCNNGPEIHVIILSQRNTVGWTILVYLFRILCIFNRIKNKRNRECFFVGYIMLYNSALG